MNAKDEAEAMKEASLMYGSAPQRSYQVCAGIRNPAEQNYSWVVVHDYCDLASARAHFREMEKAGSRPIAIIQIDARIVEKLPALDEAEAA